jgi:5-methylcytosine-specific restriction protein A
MSPIPATHRSASPAGLRDRSVLAAVPGSRSRGGSYRRGGYGDRAAVDFSSARNWPRHVRGFFLNGSRRRRHDAARVPGSRRAARAARGRPLPVPALRRDLASRPRWIDAADAERLALPAMPRAGEDRMILKPCAEVGCRLLVRKGVSRCDACKRRHEQRDIQRRGDASRRGYDHTWRKATAGFLAWHLWCARCAREGRQTPATLVGHIVAVRIDPSRRLDPSNWEALCLSCNGKQAHEDNQTASAIVRAPTPEPLGWA